MDAHFASGIFNKAYYLLATTEGERTCCIHMYSCVYILHIQYNITYAYACTCVIRLGLQNSLQCVSTCEPGAVPMFLHAIYRNVLAIAGVLDPEHKL